jgi:hypothetical protein
MTQSLKDPLFADFKVWRNHTGLHVECRVDSCIRRNGPEGPQPLMRWRSIGAPNHRALRAIALEHVRKYHSTGPVTA